MKRLLATLADRARPPTQEDLDRGRDALVEFLAPMEPAPPEMWGKWIIERISRDEARRRFG